MEFHQARLRDVVNYLGHACATLDPAKDTQPPINIILNPNGQTEDQLPQITLTARQISALEAIRVVTQVAGLNYRIEGNLVFIEP